MRASGWKIFAPWFGAFLSSALMYVAFPPVGWGQAAWIALVPLVLALRGASLKKAAWMGWLCGVLFWITSISWLRYVTVPGWILLAFYCAIFFIPFAVSLAFGFERWGAGSWLHNLGLMLWATLIWVGSEHVRATWFTGFPWNALGVALYRNLPVIQLARWGGVGLVSALAVWANLGVALTLLRYAECKGRPVRAHPELLIALLALVAALMSGTSRLRSDRGNHGETLRVAIVQPLIPIPYYYSPPHHEFIRSELARWTDIALRLGPPDLIVWPETALPDELRSSEKSYRWVQQIVAKGVPLLTGTMETERTEAGLRFYNSSVLVETNGAITAVYDKRHLVIFGEYVPLRDIFPFLKKVTPIAESFTPGTTSTVFRLSRPEVPFSVLICFEDTMAYLARESVRNGARLLINQTDNGWFDPIAAPWQHMSHCVFRCVENDVPAIRAANTGVSCAIDRFGRIREILDDENGNTYVAGCRVMEVEVPTTEWQPTFYHRHGDVFGVGCEWVMWGSMGMMIWQRRWARRSNSVSV